ncbi:M20/M25/M40 family metallo-hydrolase [Actinomadura sp. ATCC 31491]|uniref:M20/M25/M40 family metallo-hydrolase n=1 Tax=Actinomadura luzonensis TaxID=2805427 RepID=A0ABT0FNE6_9ACTN|nr:M20/M25/M40 family metallo-hydrolase [Actinomadura luzonensis]MCK2213816.1 M20/M25/M40 family metallo-hydrolase [Actinomadura luzonensis]
MRAKLIDVPRRAVAGLVAALALAAAVLLAAMTDSTMQPLPASAPPGEFSAARAFAHLERFAAEPRPIGGPAGERARNYLAGQLRAAGLKVEVQRAVGANASTGLASFGQVHNLVATRRGTASTGTLLIAAHYDSAAMGPGASDDAAAVAAMLETVRALGDAPLRNDLVLLMTDGEEDGVLGAEAFAREHPLGRAGGVLLNWEARGVAGPSLMFETSPGDAGLVRAFAAAAPRPRGDSTMAALYRLLPNNTDFTPLTAAGFAGLNFAYIERSSHYHTARDSLAELDRGSLQHHGSTMLALARALGGADLPALRAGHDATYFRIFGVMVTYPDALVWPLAGLAVAAVLGLAAVARVRRLLSVPRLVAAAVSGVLPLGGAALLAQGLWEVLVAWRPAYDGMGGLLHRPDAFRVAVVLQSGLVVLAWYLLLRRRLGPAALAVGGLAWPAGLGALCAAVAPGASFVFALPTLFCALAALATLALGRRRGPAALASAGGGRRGPAALALGGGRRRGPAALALGGGRRRGPAALVSKGGRRGAVVVLTAGAVPAVMLLSGLVRTVFDGMGLALGGASALLAALLGLMLLPFAELWLPEPDAPARPRRALRLAPAIALVPALVAAGLAADRFDARHPGRTHLAYVMDAGSRTASWVSADREPPAWTRRYVTGHDTAPLPPGYARGAGLWTGPAPALARAAAPRLTVLRRTGDRVELRVSAGRPARSVTLRVERPITEATAATAGTAPVTVAVAGTRANTWPGEIRFRGLPDTGARVTLRVQGAGKVRITAIAESDGLSVVPGFVPRPQDLVAATREDGDLVAIARTYDV